MFDRHFIPYASWGIHPILFTVFGIRVQSYPIFLMIALVVASFIYYFEARKQHKDNEHTFYIAFAAIVGGIIGAKLPIWITNYKTILSSLTDFSLILSGRTIVGGLIGGTLSVYLVKKYLKIEGRRGNFFAPAVCIGMAIGRIGCFLRGCCYGSETTLPWGVDFGDKVHRHPTQIYEIIFWLVLFVFIQKIKKSVTTPGLLFTIILTAYFFFRFVLETIKDDPDRWHGLTIYQILIIIFLLFMYRKQILHAKLKYGP